MPNPSLLIVPARFKTGRLYSQIPSNTDNRGDFNVTRATTATRVNASGLIESVASGIPRLDYYTSSGVPGCPALLVEPSGTNLCFQSQDFNTTWLAQNSATVNTNTAISPDGTQNADTINLAAVNDSRVRQTITVANSTTYTISCFYKNIALTAGQTFRMRFNNAVVAPNNFIAAAVIDLAAGTATYSLIGTSGTGFSGTATGRVENYGNGWYRVSLTFTVGTAGGAAGIFEAASIDPGAVRSFYAWGAQVETGSVATSYIPTTTASATRNADVISVSGAVSGCIGQTQGTIYAEVDAVNWTNLGRIFVVSDGTTLNAISILFNTSNRFRLIIDNGGSSAQADISSSSLSNGVHKIAVAYANNDIAFFVDGVLVGTDTSATIPACSQIFLGKIGTSSSTNFMNDRIRSAALYTTRLTNAELAALTTP